jgi:hypothetical protein
MSSAPDRFHKTLWSQQAQVYTDMWNYFDRTVFEETFSNRSDNLKYPLGINIFEMACVNHRSCLFGEFDSDVLRYRVRGKQKDKEEVETALHRIWRASSANSLMLENGLLGMILGGAVFRVMWHPVRRQVYVRLVPADAFYPVWDPDDYHEILECFIVYQIDGTQAARRFNVSVEQGESMHTVKEHWTPDFYNVTVDDAEAFWDKGHRFPMSGPNPYRDPLSNRGIIPIEYIPRDRAGGFYGIPLGKNLTGMQNAVNLKQADISDAVMQATHKHLFLRGRPGGDKGLTSLKRGKINNLGMGAPGQDQPDVFSVSAGEIPPGTIEFNQDLLNLARLSAYVPAVAHGEDEGSQRSALTLAFRMWPLASVVRASRAFWSDGLASLNRKILLVAAQKGGYNIEPRQANYEVIPLWSPMLPRDREGLVNEVAVRAGGGLISKQRAVELLEEMEDSWVQEEIMRIWADLKQEAKIQAEAAPQQGFGQSGTAKKAPSKSQVPTG